jgi:quinol monooxygenase YgiN
MAIVVERTFRIRPGALREFERLSREAVWPYFEARGCRVLGLFQQLHGGPNTDVVLMTAYESLAHWEATRESAPLPDDASDELRTLASAAHDALGKRRELTERTWSRVLQLATDWTDLGLPGQRPAD